MTFPQISIKATNITVTPQLAMLLDQKFESLGKFIPDTNDARCEVELEKITEHHQSGKIFRAEMNLFSDGKLFRAEATEEQIEQSIDKIRSEIRVSLQRASGKRQSLAKRGHQIIKNMLRFGR